MSSTDQQVMHRNFLQARVNVPDERFTWLCSVYKPKSEVPAFLEIVDIAGLVRYVTLQLILPMARSKFHLPCQQPLLPKAASCDGSYAGAPQQGLCSNQRGVVKVIGCNAGAQLKGRVSEMLSCHTSRKWMASSTCAGVLKMQMWCTWKTESTL